MSTFKSFNPLIRPLLPTNCLSVFDHFVGLAPKGLRQMFFFSLKLLTHSERLVKYVRPFFNITHDRVKFKA